LKYSKIMEIGDYMSARQALLTVFVPVGLTIGTKIVLLLWKLASVARLYTGL